MKNSIKNTLKKKSKLNKLVVAIINANENASNEKCICKMK